MVWQLFRREDKKNMQDKQAEQKMTGFSTDLDILRLVTSVVSAYVGHNAVSPGQLPGIIKDVGAAYHELRIGTALTKTSQMAKSLVAEREAKNAPESHAEPLLPTKEPAVPVEESVQDDFIICLEDGEKKKMLKRHLLAKYNLTPEQYRSKWGLARDYPMVAPGYSKRKSEHAKKVGLGTEKLGRPEKKAAGRTARRPLSVAA